MRLDNDLISIRVGDKEVRRIMLAGDLVWTRYDQTHFFQDLIRSDATGTGEVALGDTVGWVGDLTGHGAVAYQPNEISRPTLIEYQGRTMLHFDGVDDFLRIDPSPAIDFGGEPSLTVEAWYAMINDRPRQVWAVVNRYHQFILGMNDMHKMGMLIHDKSAKGSWWPENYEKDQFGQENHDPMQLHHYAGVFDGNAREIRLYIDGELVSSRPANRPTVPPDEGPIFIGAREMGDGDLNNPETRLTDAVIGDVRIWRSARTQAEIRANMNRRLSGRETGLAVYLPM